MLKKILSILIISFLLSSCGISENPASDGDFIQKHKEIFDELIIASQSGLEPILELEEDRIENEENPGEDELEIEEEHEQEEIIEREMLEPFIIFSGGHNFFSGNYIIRVISFCGAVKDLEYVHENADERHNINMYRFANAIYEQMNDDSIPVLVQFDKVPNNIIEFVETVGIVGLDTNHYYGADNWMYYIIINTDGERRAEKIGSRWGNDFNDTLGSNELTIMINEYLENTERRVP
ncbi:MAG: hypothetical protein LBD23_15585 [Oscillospiraceae bacterium]|jgi:hypothetical protein|nr:hypothetical protein [Oscillospiraceae bacterium]